MSSTTFKRPKRTNAPMQPRNRGNKMELKECITCGSHSFTDNKCDYCGNQYESTEYYADDKHDMTLHGKVYCDEGAEAYAPKKETWQEKLKVAPLSDYMKSLSDEEMNEIYSNLKDGLTPNQIRTATCKEDLVKPKVTEISFNHGNTRGNKILGFMLYLLLSIVWFAVCVFIPPLFLITICGLIIWVCRKVCKKY